MVRDAVVREPVSIPVSPVMPNTKLFSFCGASLRRREFRGEAQHWKLEREPAAELIETINALLPRRLRRSVEDLTAELIVSGPGL